MKLFIDGEEFCDAEILSDQIIKGGNAGQLASTLQERRLIVRVTKFFGYGGSVGGWPPRKYELRSLASRIFAEPLRGPTNNQVLEYEMFVDGELPPLFHVKGIYPDGTEGEIEAFRNSETGVTFVWQWKDASKMIPEVFAEMPHGFPTLAKVEPGVYLRENGLPQKPPEKAGDAGL